MTDIIYDGNVIFM